MNNAKYKRLCLYSINVFQYQSELFLNEYVFKTYGISLDKYQTRSSMTNIEKFIEAIIETQMCKRNQYLCFSIGVVINHVRN